MRHVPVLLNEVINSLQLKPGMNVVDCTLGDAGHSEEILKHTSPKGKLLGIDADSESLLRAQQFLRLHQDQVTLVCDNFSNLENIVRDASFGPVNGILMDFGWSSPQFAERGRGFSFQNPTEPLNMRYSQGIGSSDQGSGNQTASELVNTYDEKEIEKILREYGEEKLSKEIAKEIVQARKTKQIETVGDLVEIILQTYRKKLKTDKEIPWIGGLHPATKSFQALRIEVNNELGVIRQALPQAVEILAPGGRLAVITFHSLEDRIVKHYFKSLPTDTYRIITKKPIEAGEQEYADNPPSRSAKLRVIEKI
jgi:16S rRNA (cytosine1402-N4)-methyltransferase